MKSLLEMNPNKLIFIVFIFVIIVLPIALILIGIEFNAKYYGIFTAIGSGIFFYFIYPRISKNKEFPADQEKARQAGKIARQFPDVFKARIIASIILFLSSIISAYLYFIKNLYWLEFIVPVLVFVTMMYYANSLKKHKETAAYGEKLANAVKSGFVRTFVKRRALSDTIYINPSCNCNNSCHIFPLLFIFAEIKNL